MAETVYLLCAGTSAACALVLLRAHHRTGTRLLLWSGLCFVGLALNNAVLVLDLHRRSRYRSRRLAHHPGGVRGLAAPPRTVPLLADLSGLHRTLGARR